MVLRLCCPSHRLLLCQAARLTVHQTHSLSLSPLPLSLVSDIGYRLLKFFSLCLCVCQPVCVCVSLSLRVFVLLSCVRFLHQIPVSDELIVETQLEREGSSTTDLGCPSKVRFAADFGRASAPRREQPSLAMIWVIFRVPHWTHPRGCTSTQKTFGGLSVLCRFLWRFCCKLNVGSMSVRCRFYVGSEEV